MKATRPTPLLFWSLALLGWLAGMEPARAAIKQEIPPLRPPHGELAPSMVQRNPLIPWLLGAACVSFVAVILAWPRQPRLPVIEPPAARASRELRALASPTPEAVSRILRHHLVEVFHLPGEGVTTEEIEIALAGETELSHRIRDFLARCDAAKFAPHAGPAGSNLVEEAIALIEGTQASRRRVEAIAAP